MSACSYIGIAGRTKIWRRDNELCWLCGRHVPFFEMTLDHVVPKSKGGSHRPSNLRTAHLACNHDRGNRDVTPVDDRIALQKRSEP